MDLIIDGVNFNELENQKYWSFPKTYKKDIKAEVKNMVFSNDYIGSRKMDGAFYKFIKNGKGECFLLARNRNVNKEFLNKIDYIPHIKPFFNNLPNNTCLLGEIYFPNNEGSSNVTTVMGCLQTKAVLRQTNDEDKLHYYIFDVLAYDGKSYLKSKVEDRISILNTFKEKFYSPYVEYAYYTDGEKLWEMLQEILEAGGEGVVITKKGTCYQPGKRPARQTLKIKKELNNTIDVVVMGGIAPTKEYTGKDITHWKFWENEVTGEKIEGQYYRDFNSGSPIIPVTKNYWHNWAGSLQIGVVKGDKVVPVGAISGLTEEVLANFKDYTGSVMEVTCMEVLPTKGLRHPRFVQWRQDLGIRDCTWEKIYGEQS